MNFKTVFNQIFNEDSKVSVAKSIDRTARRYFLLRKTEEKIAKEEEENRTIEDVELVAGRKRLADIRTQIDKLFDQNGKEGIVQGIGQLTRDLLRINDGGCASENDFAEEVQPNSRNSETGTFLAQSRTITSAVNKYAKINLANAVLDVVMININANTKIGDMNISSKCHNSTTSTTTNVTNINENGQNEEEKTTSTEAVSTEFFDDDEFY